MNLNEEKTREEIEKELSIYYGKGFNDEQIQEIREGIVRGLNVSFYANPDFTASQMRKVWQQLNANKAEIMEKREEADRLLEEAKKEKEAINIEEKKQRRREEAIIALVLALVAVITTVIRIVGMF